MFNSVDNKPEVDGGSATAPSLQQTSDFTGSSLTHKVNLSEKDWGQLDSIMTTWVTGIQQIEYLPLDTQVNNLTTSETNPTFDTTVNSLQHINVEDSKALAQWLQRVDGSNQTSTMNPDQLVQELARVISEFQLQEEKFVEIPVQIEEKLQIILSETNIENDISGISLINNHLPDKKLSNDDRKTGASLDIRIHEGRVPFAAKVNEVISPTNVEIKTTNLDNTSMGESKSVADWLKKVDGINQNSSLDPTELVQELARLISDLQLQGGQRSIDASSEEGGENPISPMNSLLENKFIPKKPFIHPKREDALSLRGINNVEDNNVNSSLSKNENHLIFPLNTESTTQAQEVKKTEQVNNSLQIPVEISESNTLPLYTTEVIHSVAKWLQKVEGLEQNEVLEPMKLVQELTQLIEEIQTLVGIKQIPAAEIKGNFPNVSGEINIKNTLIRSQPFITPKRDDEFYRGKTPEISEVPVTNPNLIPDDKLASLPIQPKITTQPHDGAVLTNSHVNDVNPLPVSVKMNIPTHPTTTDVIKTVVQWLQKVEDRIETAPLDSSEFVQELDKLIKDLMPLREPISFNSEDSRRGFDNSKMIDVNRPLIAAEVEDSSQAPILSPLFSQTQSVPELIAVVSKWIHRVDDLNQSATFDPNQLVRELEKLLGELQTQTSINPEELAQKISNNFVTQPKIDLSLKHAPTNVNTEINLLLPKDQQTTLDPNQLIQEFKQLLSEIQLPKGQTTVENTNKTEAVLEAKSILNGGSNISIRTKQNQEENILPGQLEGTSHIKGESSYEQVTTNISKVLIQWLQEVKGVAQPTSKLDSSEKLGLENNIDFSLPNIATQLEKNMDQAALVDLVDEGTIPTDQPTAGTNQLRGTDATVSSKAMPTPPVLTFTSFVPEVSEWMGRFMKITNNPLGSTEARFSLYPEHLGHVEIKISTQEGQVSAQIITDTSLAKDTLEGQLQQLRQALQQHGVHVQKLEIVQQLPASLDSNQGNPSFSHSGSSSSHEQRTTNSGKGGSKQDNEADEIEVGREVLPAPYGKRTSKTATRIDFTA